MRYVAVCKGVYTRVEKTEYGVSFDDAKKEAYRYLKSQQQRTYAALMALAGSWPCETCGRVTRLSNTAFHRYCEEHMQGDQIK